MLRIWIKLIKENHLIKDTVIEDYSVNNRTRKIFDALEKACLSFDLAKPIWLDSNIAEFKRHSKVRFTQDSFIEPIEFDYMEFQIIEED